MTRLVAPILGLSAAWFAASPVAADSAPPAPASCTAPAPVRPQHPKIDARAFFQQLVDRYRGLSVYRDVIDLVQVTQRAGEESQRVHTKIACEIIDGTLKVQTPAAALRQRLGVDLPVAQSQPMKDAQQKYDLWLAPHMALKYADEPLKQLRPGVDEGFTATDAEHVTIDNKRMVHVELRSSESEGASENSAAKVDLYVNSDSMLIERIETEQRLPDGANFITTLQITPQDVESDDPSPVG